MLKKLAIRSCSSTVYEARVDKKGGILADFKGKSKPNELVHILKERIQNDGPMSLSTYIDMCLQHPDYGYYTKNVNISSQGDFVTSPEIYHGFGECVGIWTVFTWQQMAKPDIVHLIELGPGTGQLMSNVIHICSLPQYPALKRGLHVHLIESSPKLRQQQAEKLGVEDIEYETVKIQKMEVSPNRDRDGDVPLVTDNEEIQKFMQEMAQAEENEEEEDEMTGMISPTDKHKLKAQMKEKLWPQFNDEQKKKFDSMDLDKIYKHFNKTFKSSMDNIVMDTKEVSRKIQNGVTANGIRVSWHDSLDTVPEGPSLIIAHEFFDALPVQRFEYTDAGWREQLVDIDEEDGHVAHFQVFTTGEETSGSKAINEKFRRDSLQKPELGVKLEVCPAGNIIMADLAERVSKHGGAGFVVDYGQDASFGDSIQAVRNHMYVDPYVNPGEHDLTAHVDFSALKHSISGIDKLNVFGPVTQSFFLQGCGIINRAEDILQTIDEPEERNDMLQALQRISDMDKMGGFFKVLGFAHTSVGTMVGFMEPSRKEDLKIAFDPKAGIRLSTKKLAKMEKEQMKLALDKELAMKADLKPPNHEIIKVHSVSSTYSGIDEWKHFLLTENGDSWFSKKGTAEWIIFDMGELSHISNMAVRFSGGPRSHLPRDMVFNTSHMEDFEDVEWERLKTARITLPKVNEWHEFKVNKNARWFRVILHQTHGKENFGLTQIKFN